MLSKEQLECLKTFKIAVSQLPAARQGSSRADILKNEYHRTVLIDCQNQLSTKPFRDCSNQLSRLTTDPHQVIKQKRWLKIDIERLEILIKTYDISIEFFPIHMTAQNFEKNRYQLEDILYHLMMRHQALYSCLHPTTEYQKPLSNTYAQLKNLFFRNWVKGYFLIQGEFEQAFSYYWNKVDLKNEENWHDFFRIIKTYIFWLYYQFNLRAKEMPVPALISALEKLKVKEEKVLQASRYLFKAIGENRFEELAKEVKDFICSTKNTLSAHRLIIQSYRSNHRLKVKLKKVTSERRSEKEERQKVLTELQFTQEKLKKALTALQSKQEELEKISALQFTQEALDHARATPQSSSAIHFQETLYQPSFSDNHLIQATHTPQSSSEIHPQEIHSRPSIVDNRMVQITDLKCLDPDVPEIISSMQGPHRFFTPMPQMNSPAPLPPSLRPSSK